MNLWKIFLKFLVLMPLISIGGCATSTHYSSSVVQYLYSEQTEPVQPSEVPILSVPVKAGFAFVPETKEDQAIFGASLFSEPPGLTESEKMSLMQEVSEYFKKYDFIKSFELIPSINLCSKGSFGNLDELRTLFGVDVIILFSYDQSQFSEKGFSSILYWTLIGYYLVQGEKIDTNTMLNVAVYHIPGRKIMFRAQGTSQIRGKSTPMDLLEQTRLDSLTGFKEASKHLVMDLDEQLNLFRTMIKGSPYEFQITYEPGYLESKGLGTGIPSIGLPMADCVLVKKSERKLCLIRDDKIFREYNISLGMNPNGHKRQKGDKRTPEGRYILDWRNGKSQYYKSIHISYPNGDDIKSALSRGVKPGNMIMIHGLPNYFGWASRFYGDKDWTDGCIAVTNAEMDEIWECVPDGTPIEIRP